MSSDDRAVRFAALYQASYADLTRFVQRRTDPDQAEDIVAEAFLVAWRRFGELPARLGDARGWLFGIARNTILNSRRGVRRREALAIRLADVARPASGDGTDLVNRQIDLGAAWSRLPVGHQETLALTVLDDLSAPQAAAVLGISSVAYRLRLSRARRALRALLDHPSSPTSSPVGPRERQSS